MNNEIEFHKYVMDNYYTTYANTNEYHKRQKESGGLVDPEVYTLKEIYLEYLQTKHWLWRIILRQNFYLLMANGTLVAGGIEAIKENVANTGIVLVFALIYGIIVDNFLLKDKEK